MSDAEEEESQLPFTSEPNDEETAVVEDEDEGEGEELVGDGMETDYRARPELDTYEVDEVAEREDVEPISEGDRRAAEEELDRRDEARRRRQRVPRALADDEDIGDEDADGEFRPRRRRRTEEGGTLEVPIEETDEMVAETINIEDVRGPLRTWINTSTVRSTIARRFRVFLNTFTSRDGTLVYKKAIEEMCAANRQSLPVSYVDLSTAPSCSILAVWVADSPQDMLKILDEVAMQVTLASFSAYEHIGSEVRVRITGLPISDSLRDIRQVHLNGLIRVSGTVTRRTGVFPQLNLVKYDCIKCGYIIGPITQNQNAEIKISNCPECQSKGPFVINQEQTVYRNFQKIVLQESPGTVPAGRLPRNKEVILLGDLIDSARPGEEVEVTGIYTNNFDASLNKKNGFPVFSTVIEANYLRRKDEGSGSIVLTAEDEEQIRRLSKDPRIADRIVASMAPSIYGHEDIKLALAMVLFGGQAKEVPGTRHRIRGDINVLLLGDPGTAKSQFLKYLSKAAPRAVFTTGKGASAVGLTAAVHKDPVTREWTLEGGALVLADQGVCIIDEFDKMNDQDRTSIHEAMEQQSISISKAGIITTLQARCSVVAAANPVKGRYDSKLTFQQNVDLTEPILSRFDILCVVKDLVDPAEDERLALFVVNSHLRSHPNFATSGLDAASVAPAIVTVNGVKVDPLPQDMLQKYVTYARTRIRPKLNDVDVDKLQRLYAELRRESASGDGVSIAVRHLESLLRMTEAHARMHLRENVRDDDADAAIQVLLRSFISTQKYSVQRSMHRSFAKYLSYNVDNNQLLLFMLNTLLREQLSYRNLRRKAEDREATLNSIEIDVEDLEAKAREKKIYDLSSFFSSALFRENRFSLSQNKKRIVKEL